MVDHDKNVGTVLDVLDELGIAEDTIVIYSTDNGPHRNTWPDAGTTPFRSEKNTNWEGAFRVPELIRWPGKIKAGTVSNEIIQHHDWLPTLLAAAGDPDISDKLKKGFKAGADGNTEYKVHIDGFNLLPYLTGEDEHSPRRGFFYFSDDGDLVALRFENWKIVFQEQRCRGTLQVWAEPFTSLRVPKIFNLRTDPFEYADITSNTYYDWLMRHDFFIFYATAMATKFLETFKEFPPRHPPASFSVDQVGREAARVPGERLMLDSWNDGPTKSAIVDFVGRVTAESGPDFVAPEARVAVFDNDGTLWCEKPMYIQLDFLLRRFKEQAEADPSLRDKQPYKAAADGDYAWLGDAVTKHYQGDDTDFKVACWSDPYGAQRHHRRGARGQDQRVLRRRQASDAGPAVHRVRVRADGGADPVPGGQRVHLLHRLRRRPRLHAPDHRAAVRDTAGAGGRQCGRSGLQGRQRVHHRELEFFDDGPIKPVRLWNRIGRRPIFAAGNSNGDIEMLEFTDASSHPSLQLLVLHDDADREFDYTAGAEKSLDEAAKAGWTVVSMRNDWATVFSD